MGLRERTQFSTFLKQSVERGKLYQHSCIWFNNMYTKHCDETLCFHSEITHEIGFVNSKNFIIPVLSGFCRMGYEARCQQMILIHM